MNIQDLPISSYDFETIAKEAAETISDNADQYERPTLEQWLDRLGMAITETVEEIEAEIA